MKKREIFIELTSLLDVILIMIFILLGQAKAQAREAVDQAESERAAVSGLENDLEELKEENARLEASFSEAEEAFEKEKEALSETIDALNRRLVTDGLVMENSLVVTISGENDTSVLLEVDDGESTRIPYEWGDDNYLKNRLNSLLSGQLDIAGSRSVFIVFQYDRTKIYQTEYEAIREVIRETKLEAGKREIPLNFIELDIFE